MNNPNAPPPESLFAWAPAQLPVEGKLVPVPGGVGYVRIDARIPRATIGVIRRRPGLRRHLPRRPTYVGYPTVSTETEPGKVSTEVHVPLGRTLVTVGVRGSSEGGAIGIAVQHQDGREAALLDVGPEYKLTEHQANVLTDFAVGTGVILAALPKHKVGEAVAAGFMAGLLNWGLREITEALEKAS